MEEKRERLKSILEQRVAEQTQQNRSLAETISRLSEDITQQRQSGRHLNERDAHYRVLFNRSPSGILLEDTSGTILEVNDALCLELGYSRADLVGKNIRKLVAPGHQADVDQNIANILAGQTLDHVVENIARDGGRRYMQIREATVRLPDQRPGILVVSRDVTEHTQLRRHVLEIVADEQRRIGQELHDSIGQELTGLSLFAGAFQEILQRARQTESTRRAGWELEVADYQRLCEMIGRLTQALTTANQHVHRLSHSIMPVPVDTEGLGSALEELVAATDALHGVTCHFYGSRRVAPANNTSATHLYRIAQEALNNALHHSLANEIQVSLYEKQGQIVLEVSDNGIGINSPLVTESGTIQQGMGLRMMRFRAGMVGGVFSVEPQHDGKGTLVRCLIPANGM